MTLTWADPDLWGHLRFGLDAISTGEFTSVDPYSFTQDVPWINHEWLSETLMALAYQGAGVAGLALLKGVLLVLTLAMIWCGLVGVDPAVRFTLVVAAAAGTGRLSSTLRPQLWTFLLLVLTLRVLMADARRRRWWLPLVLASWANLHGGWIVGLGVIGAWLAVEAWTDRPCLRAHAALAACALLATLATPYGIRLWKFIAGTVRLGGRAVSEWQPIWTTPPANWVVWLLASAAALWALTWGRDRLQHRWPSTVVLLMLALAAVRVERLAPLYVISAAVLLTPVAAGRWPASGRPLTPVRGEAVVAAGLTVVLAGIAIGIGASSLRCVRVEGAWVPDAVAARALDAARPGRLVTFFDWGQYALWHWGPGLRVSMDGRRETVYSDTVLSWHDAIVHGEPAGFERLATWRAEYVWHRHGVVTPASG